MTKTRLVILPECQIGAIKFSIYRNDFLLEKLNQSGDINHKEQKLRIAHREVDQEFLTLVHEAFHGIVAELGYELDEGCILALSTGITIFLQSLGIEPDFSQIPEEVQ